MDCGTYFCFHLLYEVNKQVVIPPIMKRLIKYCGSFSSEDIPTIQDNICTAQNSDVYSSCSKQDNTKEDVRNKRKPLDLTRLLTD